MYMKMQKARQRLRKMKGKIQKFIDDTDGYNEIYFMTEYS